MNQTVLETKPYFLPTTKVNKLNTNLWRIDSNLTKELRKCRWKKNDPLNMDKFEHPIEPLGKHILKREFKQSYGYAGSAYDPYEDPVTQANLTRDTISTFRVDMEIIAKKFLKPREAAVAFDWIFEGATQQETAKKLGMCQASVHILRSNVKIILKQQYFTKEAKNEQNL